MMVPAMARVLLDFVGDIEANGDYEAIYGHNQRHLPKPLTRMTIAEVQADQPRWTHRFGSSAAGKYQIMWRTLRDLTGTLNLSGRELFDKDMQDRLGYALLSRRGYHDFMAGRIGIIEFGANLAKEWASLPVLAFMRGAHRDVMRGESYYAGDKVNKALVEPHVVERVLLWMRAPVDDDLIPTPTPPLPPMPGPPTERKGSWIAVFIVLVIIAVGGFLLWRFVL